MRINTQRGVAPLVAVIIALLAIGGGTYAVKKSRDMKKESKETAATTTDSTIGTMGTSTIGALVIKLNEQNNSGQSGQAVITQVGSSTVKVIVNLTGKPSGVPQPAHIHLGSCPNPGAVKYPLTNVGNGASQTEIQGLTLQQLLGERPLAINVHKSTTEASVYVACGDITDAKGATSTTTEKAGKETKVTYNTAGFSPKTVTIKKGETVVFDNKTGKAASVASDEHPTHLLYPEFDQYKTSQRGATEFRFTFEKVGTWKYHDHLNAAMGGTVVVTE